MLRLLCKFHYAIHVAWGAAFNFNLNSAVADTVFMLQSFRDNSQYILTFTNSLLFDGDVTTAATGSATCLHGTVPGRLPCKRLGAASFTLHLSYRTTPLLTVRSGYSFATIFIARMQDYFDNSPNTNSNQPKMLAACEPTHRGYGSL